MHSERLTGTITDQFIHTAASDGRPICIRSIRTSDADQMRSGIAQLSLQSRYLRFFSVQPMPSDSVIERLVDADGHEHIAWGAIDSNGSDNPAIGAVHAIRSTEHERIGEYSVAVLDAYQGIGIGRMLTAVLLIHCRLEKIDTLDIQTLAENQAAIHFIRSIGAELRLQESGVHDYALSVTPALDILRRADEPQGVVDVFRALDRFL